MPPDDVTRPHLTQYAPVHHDADPRGGEGFFCLTCAAMIRKRLNRPVTIGCPHYPPEVSNGGIECPGCRTVYAIHCRFGQSVLEQGACPECQAARALDNK